jgi:hypothetical protein
VQIHLHLTSYPSYEAILRLIPVAIGCAPYAPKADFLIQILTSGPTANAPPTLFELSTARMALFFAAKTTGLLSHDDLL